jgi:asparagine synthase (glutamine-hydrolysing)
MSGGLDSTAVTVNALNVLATRGGSFDLRAHTVVYDTLIRDHERHYATITARQIGITPRYLAADDALPFDGWLHSAFRTAEPTDDPFHLLQAKQLQEVASGSRTALVGDGGDEVFWRPYVVDLIGRMPLWHLGRDIVRCVVHGRRPAGGIRAKLATWRRRAPAPPPIWLSPEFASRWRFGQAAESSARSFAKNTNALRPDAYRRLSSPLWPSYLESADPGVTRVPLEHRWPFLDLRLVSYVLAIPPLPWCVDKRLLRLAMRGSLPEVVLRRPKSPLTSDPLRAHLQARDYSWLDRFEATPQLARFVNRRAIPRVATIANAENTWLDLRPFCLNYWLSRVNDYAS